MKALQAGAPPDKLFVVGDLMLDAVETHWQEDEFCEALGLDREQPVIGLFPGSRPWEFRHVLPLFLRSAEIISRDLQTVQFALSVSPFVTEDDLRDVLASPSPLLEGSGGRLSKKDPLAFGGSRRRGLALNGSAGVAARSYALSCAGGDNSRQQHSGDGRLGIAHGGSNSTEQAGADSLEGIPGLIGSIPLVGRYLKRKAVLTAAKRIKFAALPNMKAQEEIVPELIGFLGPEDVAVAVGSLLRSPEKLRAMSSRLQQIMGARGAAGRIAETLAGALSL